MKVLCWPELFLAHYVSSTFQRFANGLLTDQQYALQESILFKFCDVKQEYKVFKLLLSWIYRSTNPLELHRLSFPGDLWFTLVTPKFEAPTAKMRAVLPKDVPMQDFINNCSMGGSLVCFSRISYRKF